MHTVPRVWKVNRIDLRVTRPGVNTPFSLALCASTVLFVLSQDRLNMDLDRESLELMLNLLDTDSRIKDALDGAGMNKRELEKNKQKVSKKM